jgi:hypothetical protein
MGPDGKEYPLTETGDGRRFGLEPSAAKAQVMAALNG